MIEKVRKRDGRVVPFDSEKIVEAIWKAARSVGGKDRTKAEHLGRIVINILEARFGNRTPNVEEVQDIVEKVLIEEGHAKTAKAYILYRKSHQDLREVKGIFDTIQVVEDYVGLNDWAIKENSNMGFSLQGLNNYIAEKIIKSYWLNRIYPESIRKIHENADIHIHDLGTLGPYCVGWDLRDLLLQGFTGVPGKVQTKPAKRLRTALGHIVNFFYTLQGESAGAQAFSNFDTLLAPFVRYDKLDYNEVRQCLQEFCFNLAVPTRVGFQCMSEDTEILTPSGWRGHLDLKKGDIIKTFNIEKGVIENKPIKNLFAREYSGVMYNLKNRIQDQLISPKHRVVRKKFNGGYVLEEIEEVCSRKAPFIVPVAAESSNKEIPVSDEQIKLMAWIIGEGSVERPGAHRCCSRVSIYQSAIKNESKYREIKGLLSRFKLKYEEYTQKGLGQPVQRIRLDAGSSKVIHDWFKTKESVKFIPEPLLDMSQRQSKIFLETYMKAEGFEGCKIATSDEQILNGLQAIAVNAGYGSTVLTRKPTIGTKPIFVLRLIYHQDTYIQSAGKIHYNGIIWCPNTDNETVIARRNGKVFITGNTPFTNITLDLKIPEYMKNEPVIIGGKFQKETYGDFQKEADMINKAFAEVMLGGDAKGRLFTFPIPTYNITKDFDWDNPDYDGIWEMTAKYGIPYFSNFVNSDMKPEDARSMCCRLRLDQTELRKKGGGLFGANPLTGSVGVVTINMPRLGFTCSTEKEFLDKLGELMDLAKESLEIKRKALESFTKNGLYPYSKFYLRNVYQRFGSYWKNHFSTIGLLGMNEAITNFMEGESIATPKGREFASRVLDFMRERLERYQEESGHIYNLEATPGEGTTYRFARADKNRFGTIKVANEINISKGAKPYYTNSTHLPVGFTDDLFSALELQDPLQVKYNGGTVFHAFIGERLEKDAVKLLVKKIADNFRLPYFTLTPTFSVCPVHGYLAGEHEFCPVCDKIQEEQKLEVTNEN